MLAGRGLGIALSRVKGVDIGFYFSTCDYTKFPVDKFEIICWPDTHASRRTTRISSRNVMR